MMLIRDGKEDRAVRGLLKGDMSTFKKINDEILFFQLLFFKFSSLVFLERFSKIV